MSNLLARCRLQKFILNVHHQQTTAAAVLPSCQHLPQRLEALHHKDERRGPLVGAVARFCQQVSGGDAEQEVYRGILSTQIKLVKTFSLCTSLIGLAFQPVLYTYSSQGNLAVVVASGAFLSFFTFATPLLIHTISKKYVTKLYYNQVEDKYTAHVYNLFVRPKKIEFRVSDVNVPDIPGMFTTFKACNIPLFVEMNQFNDPKHYGKIMGYDKPLDLKWDRDLNITKSEAEAQKKKQE